MKTWALVQTHITLRCKRALYEIFDVHNFETIAEYEYGEDGHGGIVD